jgi:hypothetical protein
LRDVEEQLSTANSEVERLKSVDGRLDQTEQELSRLKGLEQQLSTAQAEVLRLKDLDQKLVAANAELSRLTGVREQLTEAEDQLTRLRDLEAAETRRRVLKGQLEQTRRDYLSLRAPADTGSDQSRRNLMDLLEVKLQVQKILLSEPIRSEYPQLYQRFDQYLQALVTEQEQQAQDTAFTGVNELLSDLVANKRPEIDTFSRLRSDSSQDQFVTLLDRLGQLLQP